MNLSEAFVLLVVVALATIGLSGFIYWLASKIKER